MPGPRTQPDSGHGQKSFSTDADGKTWTRHLKHGVVLSVIAFGLHLLWEYAQCSFFYVHGSFDKTWVGMAMAAGGDVFLTWAAYVLVAGVSGKWRWAGSTWSRRQILSLYGSAAVLAVAIEMRALAAGRWDYLDAMPTIPGLGVGLVPVVQLILLTPIVILLSERLAGRVVTETATETAQRRYDRIAPVYDLMEWGMERGARGWREELWERATGKRVLEVGVGTGKNFPYYPEGAEVVGIDISEGMLSRARQRADRLGVEVTLDLADAQALPYEDATYDVVLATFVFCSVPDPIQGLREAFRVLKPGGRLLLLEHVRSELPVLGTLMRWLDPIPYRIFGAHIARDTVANVKAAGFESEQNEKRMLDIVRLIQAPRSPQEDS